MMSHFVSKSVVSRLLPVATGLMLVGFAASANLQPDSALASVGERADLGTGVVYLEDDNNGNRGDDNQTNDENRNHGDDNGNNKNDGNSNGNHDDDNGNRHHGNGEDREADTGPQIASAGNGGVATASADGGVVLIGDINSGGNAGNAIGVGDTTWGSVTVDGGDVANSTGIAVTVDGGTGIADASGGNGNLAGVQD
jgi:hypothetical protein